MRVALLTTDSREHCRDYHLTRPGFGTAPDALISGFARMKGVELHVVSCAQRRMESPEKLADNIHFHSLHVGSFGWLKTGYQGCVRAVRRLLRRIRPDIVHGQGTERDCGVSAAWSGFPNVITIHGNMGELARLFRARIGGYHWLAARLENLTLKRTDGVFCNSNYTEGLVRNRTQKTWVVPNALRDAFFSTPRSLRSKELRLLNIGVLSERKRQLELLKLATELNARGFSCQWRFVGPLPNEGYASEFMRAIAEPGTASTAVHLGTLDTEEIIREIDEAAALVHFPSEEAFGLVAAEALARGARVFASRVGGVIDIAAGVPGVELFDAGDWRGLGEGIERWIADGGGTGTDGARGMRERYHPEVVAARHVEIYRELTAVRGSLP